ncbi:anthranilate phosphoribosyltransferase [Litorihabitans aurantiacus]|uniref:Anthranilate phosphoribosyltransferase n=1 Tax=Litorihabitans aurantiacus TaxID=1930061 RepID=A0AA38CT57_9MICO|nr:anthranilate phosphoribosyltransferase [Litorihabitans aurantiacus]GMA31482.1 anthranilate phosphoribosyltransferase 1 [Litorihabitans aurantiacus]
MTAWSELLGRLVSGGDLSAAQARGAMEQVMAGDVTPVALAGLLVALAAKGETVEELGGFADAMVSAAVPLPVQGRTVDIVGTGGDRHRSVNISTMAALVAAGTGLRVVKHGNRAASSASGAADVLEALGVRLDAAPARVADLAHEVGITFAFAQVFHPSMRHAGPARRELGIPTVFNVLGPLTNPARPAAGAIGVANARMAPLMAGVFAERGSSVLLYRSGDGLDEWATTAPARIWEVSGGRVVEHEIDAVTAFGMPRATLEDLRGADAAFNADVVRRVLAGERGPVRDAVVLGAASAVVADGTRTGDGELVERMREGIAIAQESIDSGAAAGALERWVTASAASPVG